MKPLLYIGIFLTIMLNHSLSFAIWPFGPSNYEECISKGMKGVTSDIAARAIIQSCRKQFLEKKKEGKPIPDTEVRKINGTLKERWLGGYMGEIYNGSSYIISDIFIVIKTFDFNNNIISNRTYRISEEIKPQTAELITITAPEESNKLRFYWYVVEAWGYQ